MSETPGAAQQKVTCLGLTAETWDRWNRRGLGIWEWKPAGFARRGRSAAGGKRSPLLLGVCSVRLNILELAT